MHDSAFEKNYAYANRLSRRLRRHQASLLGLEVVANPRSWPGGRGQSKVVANERERERERDQSKVVANEEVVAHPRSWPIQGRENALQLALTWLHRIYERFDLSL